MAVIITAAMLRDAARHNQRMPDEERWSRIVRQTGRLARKVKRDGIEASELRDERPKRANDFGSELPVCRKHGSKGSTKTLPGKRKSAGRGQVNTSIVMRNSMIKAGLVPVVVIRRGERLVAPIAESVIMPECGVGNISFDMLKRMLTPVR